VLPRYSPRYSPRSLRILVADDEPDSVTALKLLLNDEGHDVVTLSKGAEVLRMIEEFKPDVVVLDIAMPDKSGYEIAKEIRKRYGVITPLLIAITGRYKQASDKMLGQIVGFDHYLLKPYEPNELLALLRFC
jgi:DNA-binding response OmpR family regulator